MKLGTASTALGCVNKTKTDTILTMRVLIEREGRSNGWSCRNRTVLVDLGDFGGAPASRSTTTTVRG